MKKIWIIIALVSALLTSCMSRTVYVHDRGGYYGGGYGGGGYYGQGYHHHEHHHDHGYARRW